MRGTNPIRKQVLTPDGSLHVQQIFHTIQGEGPFAGLPAVFIRLAGCNLRCHFCDTEFESGMERDTMPATSVAEQAYALASTNARTSLVVLTGGEPLRQNILPLLNELLYRFSMHVQIETAGTVWLPGLSDYLLYPMKKRMDAAIPLRQYVGIPELCAATVVISPKTGNVNSMAAEAAIAWKYIVRAGELNEHDGLPEFATQLSGSNETPLPCTLSRPLVGTPATSIYLQPCDEGIHSHFGSQLTQLNTKAAVDACLLYGYRMSLQQHKVLGLE